MYFSKKDVNGSYKDYWWTDLRDAWPRDSYIEIMMEAVTSNNTSVGSPRDDMVIEGSCRWVYRAVVVQ